LTSTYQALVSTTAAETLGAATVTPAPTSRVARTAASQPRRRTREVSDRRVGVMMLLFAGGTGSRWGVVLRWNAGRCRRRGPASAAVAGPVRRAADGRSSEPAG